VGSRQSAGVADALAPPAPFAERNQYERQQGAEQDPGGGSEPALLNRETHKEEAAQRDGDAADPHDPLGAEALFEASLARCGYGGNQGHGGCGWLRPGNCGRRMRRLRRRHCLGRFGNGRRLGWNDRAACAELLLEAAYTGLKSAHPIAQIERHPADDGYGRERGHQKDQHSCHRGPRVSESQPNGSLESRSAVGRV
jgi:hypothetical protein